MKLLIFSIFSCLAFSVSVAATDCQVSSEKLVEYLKMNYQEFDQTPGKGFRELVDQGCFVEAGKLIDLWHFHSQENLEPWQKRISYWHAGQSYAFAEQALYPLAVERFQKSINHGETANDDFKWNAYVRGSIAFLRSDRSNLEKYRDELSSTTTAKMNLEILDRMLRCFGQPYLDAYGGSGNCN